jgi:sec-independent protein translocase protein TatC
MAEQQDPFEPTRMTLGEHLEELRKRLFRSVIALAICVVAAWSYKEELAQYVMRPWTKAVAQINDDLVERYDALLAEEQARAAAAAPGTPEATAQTPRSKYFTSDDPADKTLRQDAAIDARLTALGAGDSFFFAFNISVYFAAFIGGPFVLWQMWQFIAAGLYKKERRLVYLYFPFSMLLFLGGVLFCYFLVLPIGLYFLSSTMPIDQIKPQMTTGNYFDFLSTMCLAMGAVFQLPILMIFLSSLGIIEPRTYSKYRAHFLVIALFVSAIVTPGTDYYSQILMTIPMYVLYEVGILISRWRARPRQHPGGTQP